MIQTIKPGINFVNGTMELTVLSYTEINGNNLALIIRNCDGMFITVRNLSPWQEQYVWDWGHYFTDLREALDDYDARKKDL